MLGSHVRLQGTTLSSLPLLAQDSQNLHEQCTEQDEAYRADWYRMPVMGQPWGLRLCAIPDIGCEASDGGIDQAARIAQGCGQVQEGWRGAREGSLGEASQRVGY